MNGIIALHLYVISFRVEVTLMVIFFVFFTSLDFFVDIVGDLLMNKIGRISNKGIGFWIYIVMDMIC